MRRFLSQPAHEMSRSFYVICALLTRKKEACQKKQEKAKAALEKNEILSTALSVEMV
jgi:hypothetical protein